MLIKSWRPGLPSSCIVFLAYDLSRLCKDYFPLPRRVCGVSRLSPGPNWQAAFILYTDWCLSSVEVGASPSSKHFRNIVVGLWLYHFIATTRATHLSIFDAVSCEKNESR